MNILNDIKKPSLSSIILIIILSFIAFTYLFTLAVNHSEAEDSLEYLIQISSGNLGQQFHANHLLYNFSNYCFYGLWQRLGYSGNAERPAETLNVLASLACLFLLYVILLKLKMDLIPKLSALMLTALSYGWWWYSVECETYILPMFFVLFCIFQMMRVKEDFFDARNHIVLGASQAIAMLFHIQHAILIFPILAGYFYIFITNRGKIKKIDLVLRFSLYASTTVIIITVAYLYIGVFIQGLSSIPDILLWARGRLGTAAAGHWGIASPLKALIGISRSFIGGHFLFAWAPIASLLQRLLPNYSLVEEIFLVKDYSSRTLGLLAFSSVVFILSMAFLIFYIIRKRAFLEHLKRSPDELMVFTCASVLLITYLIFNIWWEPHNVEFWIPCIPVFSVILSLLIQSDIRDRLVRLLPALIITTLFFSNLLGSILPQNDRNRDYWYTSNRWPIANLSSKDLIVSGGGYIADNYLRFYANTDVLSVFESNDINSDMLERIRSTSPAHVYISSTAFYPNPAFALFKGYELSLSKVFLQKVGKRIHLIYSDRDQSIYRYNYEQ